MPESASTKVTMNMFGRMGRIVADPVIAIKLDGSNLEFGSHTTQYDYKEVIEWLLMQEHGVGMDEARKMAMKKNTCLSITDLRGGKELHFFYRTGYHGAQLLMFA